jgi:predicted nucleotidyltransferase
MANLDDLKQRYQAAFDSFLAKVQADDSVIAVYLFGSLARGDLWEKSDLDVFVVVKDERIAARTYALVEHGITFHCDVYSRSQFRRIHERHLRGSVAHQVFTSGKLVFTRDDSLHEFYRDLGYTGERDRELLALHYGIWATCNLHDVQKAMYAHQDAEYTFVWLLELVKQLACVETALSGQSLQREVIHQALACNPQAFTPLFYGLIDGKKDLPALLQVLEQADAYLEERAGSVFSPILSYLREAGEVRGASDLSRHFAERLRLDGGEYPLFVACEWLVEKGWLQKVCAPVKLTTKGRVFVDEPAYFLGA